MAKDPHDRIVSGDLNHRCDNEPKPRLIKNRIIDEPGDLYITIAASNRCEHGIFHFSTGIMSTHPAKPFNPAAKKPEHNCLDVVRACSSHSNYHLHIWDFLRPLAKEGVRQQQLLHTLEDVAACHKDAVDLTYVDPEEVRLRWRTKQL